jgi:hypothetical protein
MVLVFVEVSKPPPKPCGCKMQNTRMKKSMRIGIVTTVDRMYCKQGHCEQLDVKDALHRLFAVVPGCRRTAHLR